MTDMKFETGLSFASVYMKKKHGKKHGKTIITDRYIKYITTCRFLHNQYYLKIGYVID